jgi:cytochrome c oxidase assembly factor CtaG
VEPLPVFVIVFASLLYTRGFNRRGPGHRAASERRWRAAGFYGGLLCVVIALDTPVDPLSERLFAVHMAQHLLLLVVAPALIVLSAPWLRLWQPLPLGFRRTVAKSVARGRWSAPLRLLGRLLSRPIPAFVLFCAVLVVWHIPSAYDATLSNQNVHEAEHATFFAAGLLFWIQVLDSPPVRARLTYGQRAVYLIGATLVSWVLALVLAFSHKPFYGEYVHLVHRPGGLSALTDQQLAAGVMWVPGSIPFTIAIIWALYRWLEPTPEPRILAGRNGHRLRTAGGN